ncbi:MAG: choice-of-anchor D domain-containing protein, partial [Flavobacterium sp.]
FAINTRGFEYSVNSTMSASATKSSAATATGTYSENLTGLTANTLYYYRALAKNDCSPHKTGYSHTSAYPTFTTLHNAPNVGTGTGATSSSFTAQWTAPTGGGGAAFTYEIQVDDDSNFSSVNFTANGITGITTLVNTGLTPSTTYYYRVRAVNAGGNSAWSSTSVGYATTAPAPEINIKQGSTSIASTSTFDIGNQISGTTGSAITFTIENTGNAPLSVGALSKSGADAALFTITQPLSASVAASGTTTFTVTFAPTTMGGKTAQLSLVNGDDDENPYLINLSGTGTANATSDIITDNTFTYTTNIDYKNYITADITALNSVELGRFIIRDGGTGDADNVGTTLNSLSISVANADNLERLAIYDGDTKLAEMPALATTNFTGFSLSAADNGTKTFTIRGSFKTIVTDKQRITLTLSSATASETGSGFTTINATTSTTGSNNTINVTADRLAFTTQPIDTGINTAMANVVVSSVDINNNKDIDATGEISITSTGTLTVTPLTANLVNGSATFNNIIHNVAQSARNLIASISGFSDLNSNLFNITEIIYANGDYRSKTTGTWTNHATVLGTATWQRYKASTSVWEDISTEPTGNADTYTVYIEHDIIIPSGGTQINATAKIHILSGAKLTFQPTGTQWTFRNIIVENGATLQMDGRFYVLTSGEFEIMDGGTFIYNYSANPSLGLTNSLWAGNEKFHPNSNFIIKANDGNGNFLPATSNLTARTFNGSTAYFGNLIVNFNTRITSGTFNSPMLTHGNLEFITLANYSLLDANYNWTIGKNLILNSASAGNLTLVTGSTGILNIKGNLINNSNKIINLNTSTGTMTLNVDGNIILDGLSGCSMNINNGGTSVLNLKGDLTVVSTAQLTSTAAGTSFNFTGTGDGVSNLTTQNVSIIPSTATNINFNVKENTYVKLDNNLVLGSGSKLTVENGGTFDFGFSETTPLIITGTTFEAQANSKLKITSPDGIATSGPTGNVQTTNRTFGLADYQYTGITNQITGTGLPTSGAKITSANTGTAPNNEVLLTNASTTVSALDIKNGVFNLNEKALTGTNLSIAENTTLKIVGTQSFPSFTNKTFHNNGIVEYGGANQSIAALTNPAYTKLKVSGTGTKVLSGTTVEATNSLAITSSLLEISEGQTLRIQNEITTIDTDANNGLFIKNGGSLIQTTEVNNQTTNANVGKIKMERITKPMYRLDYTYWSAPVSENTLIALSPNSPANKFFHWNPNAVSPAPNWAVITGGTAQMIPGKGYIIRAPTVGNGTDATNPASYTAFNGYFNGKPNNGTVTTPVSGPEKWNLIGNPYPSALDAEKFLDDNATLDGTLYFWTHNTPLTGASGYGYSAEDYAAWNGTGSLATIEAPSDSDPADNKPKGFIAAGQSFFVKGLTNENAVFTNSMRENANNMQFFKSENTEKHRVWLNLKGAEKGFSQTLVGYISNATNGQDHRYDGETFGGNAVAFYSVMENKKWSIQGRALPFVATDEVSLGYKTTLTGTLIINIDDRDGQLATQNIYLKDNLLNVVHNLTDSPYSFTSTPGTFDDRFVLRYLPGENLDNPTFEDQMDGLTIRKNNTDIYINSSFENIDAVLIYDIMGRLLFEKEKCNTTSFKASNLTQSEQMLIVKVRLNNGGVVTKKVW